MKKVKIYTDGSCLGNPGPGGWCAILIYRNHKKILKGFKSNTTNNQMEMIAMIEGLKTLKEPCEVELYSDSNYIIRAFTDGWLNNWIQNGWKRKKGNQFIPVKNIDLWKTLLKLFQQHNIQFMKVKAHSGDPYNEECDKIAKEEAEKARKQLDTQFQ